MYSPNEPVQPYEPLPVLIVISDASRGLDVHNIRGTMNLLAGTNSLIKETHYGQMVFLKDLVLLV